MAGRLRTQLKRLEAIREAADALYSLVHDAAPKDMFATESMLERAVSGELADEKAEHWHRMLGGAFDCSDSAMQLGELVEERNCRLPTYKPPPPVSPPATETTDARVESATDRPTEA